MPRLTPFVFLPSQQFRFKVISSKLPGAALYCKGAQQPKLANNSIKVDHYDHYIKVKGRTAFSDIQLSCYEYEGITSRELAMYFMEHHSTREGVDRGTGMYKHDLYLGVLNPELVPVGWWKLTGAFFESIDWGQLDWGNSDVIAPELVVTYDYAMYGNVMGGWYA